MSEAALPTGRAEAPRGTLSALSLAALGVVFGDIGTSPLYTLKTVLDATGAYPSRGAVLGSLSLIIWTLLIITTVKYVTLAMRVDNDGEGGILALMSLLGIKRRQRRVIVLVGLFGAALIYGDGAITPAISVLSALEGLDIMIPGFERFVVPLAVLILLALFAAQRQGTARIGGLFGPVMAFWFAVIALLGIYGITLHPAVLVALNPLYGLRYLLSGGPIAFAVLGGVFLCVTGAEALYADMGHFGARPIRAAWTLLVLPSLVLSYAGQAAIVLSGAPTSDNIFYRLCPPLLLPGLILLATVATIIASQAIITGAFSMTRQAILLGWMPRLPVTQTSAAGYGQIYVGTVNWLLMLVTIGLTVGFGKSDNLAAAYGIAVSLTMLMTTVLLFIAMREIWRWRLPLAAATAGVLFVIDAAFVSANMLKLADGGYVPLILAGLVYGVMLTWHAGVDAIRQRADAALRPLGELMQRLEHGGIARVPGTAIFLTRTEHDTPPVLLWYLKTCRAVQEKVLIITVKSELVPWIAEESHLTIEQIGPNLWRARARFGFMERPDIPALVAAAHNTGCALDLNDIIYVVGRETVVRATSQKRLPFLVAMLFAFLQRNSARSTDYFSLPAEQVLEIGREIAV
jgi:KUP system potassium uptake protein